MIIIEFIKALILGIVEGLTEFALVSSIEHVILVDDMWLQSSQFLSSHLAFTFKIIIQLGSVFVAAWVFRERYFEVLHIGKYRHVAHSKGMRSKPRRLNLLHVLVGVIPAGILGVLFDNFIEAYLFGVPTIVIGLFIGVIYMITTDKYSTKVRHPQTVDQINYFRALVIGISQAVAMWPGLSRSGSTIPAGVLMKLNHKSAPDSTSIMAVPITLTASTLSLLKNCQYIDLARVPFCTTGFLAVFIVDLVAIKTFLHLVNKVRLVPFAIYRIVLVIFIAILYFGFGIGKGI